MRGVEEKSTNMASKHALYIAQLLYCSIYSPPVQHTYGLLYIPIYMFFFKRSTKKKNWSPFEHCYHVKWPICFFLLPHQRWPIFWTVKKNMGRSAEQYVQALQGGPCFFLTAQYVNEKNMCACAYQAYKCHALRPQYVNGKKKITQPHI